MKITALVPIACSYFFGREVPIGCMKSNTTKVGNIRAYLITALYNAPNTMSHYYSAEVNHDLYGVV